MDTASHPTRDTAQRADHPDDDAPLDLLDVERTGRAAATYHELKRRLLAGEFALGDRMAEGRLADQLGVSRTPVREALSRLSAEGLVERQPHGGYGPVAPDLHLARDLYEVRFALELDAMDRPTRLTTSHDLDQVRELRSDWLDLTVPGTGDAAGPDFALLDEDFHLRLAASAGNEALCELLLRVNERIRPVRMHDFLTDERVTRTIHQHLGILDALLLGDEVGARTLLQDHFAESLAVVEERATAALVRMVTRHRPGSIR